MQPLTDGATQVSGESTFKGREQIKQPQGPALFLRLGKRSLRKNLVLSEAEEKFAAGLYRFISDEAVHPLVAEREYARLARNVVIEYALLFSRKLEKLGLKPH